MALLSASKTCKYEEVIDCRRRISSISVFPFLIYWCRHKRGKKSLSMQESKLDFNCSFITSRHCNMANWGGSRCRWLEDRLIWVTNNSWSRWHKVVRFCYKEKKKSNLSTSLISKKGFREIWCLVILTQPCQKCWRRALQHTPFSGWCFQS